MRHHEGNFVQFCSQEVKDTCSAQISSLITFDNQSPTYRSISNSSNTQATLGKADYVSF